MIFCFTFNSNFRQFNGFTAVIFEVPECLNQGFEDPQLTQFTKRSETGRNK